MYKCMFWSILSITTFPSCNCSGMSSSCQDLTYLWRSPVWRDITRVGPNLLFSEGQYLLGDSRYMALPHLVAAFNRLDTDADKEDFNTCVAKCRVVNEHCIGVLKSRWHSMKNLRTQLNYKRDSAWIMRWINMCAKLHNFVASMKDECTELDDTIDLEADDPAPGPEIPLSRAAQGAAGLALLRRVMDGALEFNRRPGGFLWQPKT